MVAGITSKLGSYVALFADNKENINQIAKAGKELMGDIGSADSFNEVFDAVKDFAADIKKSGVTESSNWSLGALGKGFGPPAGMLIEGLKYIA
jgi:hypothetical protein